MSKVAGWVPSVSTKPLNGESRRGYLIRACERNGWPSFGSFLRPIGVSQSAFDRGDNHAGLERALGMLPGWLATFTDGFDGNRFVINCHQLPASRVRRSDRCVCPDCLKKERFQRSWWDIDMFVTCPVHDRPLVFKCGCGTPLSWTDPSLDMCSKCAGNVCHLPLPSETVHSPFDAYMLVRLLEPDGDATGGILDTLQPGLVVQFVEDVAGLMATGYSTARPVIEHFADAGQRRDEAFVAIRKGKLTGVLELVASQYYDTTLTLTPPTPIDVLGWFSASYGSYRSQSALDEHFRAALSQAVGFPVHDVDLTEYLHVDALAIELGLSSTSVIERLVRSKKMNLVHGQRDNLFVPLDIAWELDRV